LNSTLKSLLFWIVLVVVGVLIWNFSTKLQQHERTATFSEFMSAVDSGSVESVTIPGQEIVGVSKGTHETFHTYAPAQYDALARLLPAIDHVRGIRHVVGHEHVAPGRKIDPGPGFDWVRLASRLQWDDERIPPAKPLAG